MLSFDHITMAEIATIEKLSNLPITAIQQAETPKGQMLAAMALVAKRRTGSPEFTWADAQELTLKDAQEVNAFFQVDADEEETEQEQFERENAAADELGLTTPDADAVAFDEQRAADGRGNVETPSTASDPLPID